MTKKDNNTSDQFDEELDKYQKALDAVVIPGYFLSEQFCNNGIENTDYTIPPTSTTDPKVASFDTGAPMLQQVKPELGGAVFPRQEYNGILRLLSNLLVYQNKGNYFTFDPKNTGGYSLGAVLYDYNTNKWVVSLQANNTANFTTNPTLIDNVNWAFVTVNPNTVNNFTISPTVPTPAINDNSLKAINSAFFFNNYATATKYNFVVTGQNTPTFATGEEYIIAISPDEYTEYDITLRGGYQAGASSYGEITIKFSIEHSGALGYSTANYKIISVSSSTTPGFTQTQLNSFFTFKAYLTSAPYTINGNTLGASTIIYTMILNASLYSGTANSIFASVSSNRTTPWGIATINYPGAILGILPTPITGSAVMIAPQYVAYLDSPAFINNPTAPTKATTDNSTSLATTAYVQNNITTNRMAYYSANGTFTVPAGITKIFITAIGGGGGGGGSVVGTAGTSTIIGSLIALGGGAGGAAVSTTGGYGGGAGGGGDFGWNGQGGSGGIGIGGSGGGPAGGRSQQQSSPATIGGESGGYGSGGGGGAQPNVGGAGGGGSGGYIQYKQFTVTPLQSIAITIGNNGNGGTGTASVGAGGGGGTGYVLIQW